MRLVMEGTKAQMNLNNFYSLQVLESHNQALLFHTDILTSLSKGIFCPNCLVFHSFHFLH